MNNSLVRSMYTWQWSNYSKTTSIINVIVIGSLGVLAAITKSYLFVGIFLVFFLDVTPSTVKQSSPCLFSLCLLSYGNSFLQGSTLVLLLPDSHCTPSRASVYSDRGRQGGRSALAKIPRTRQPKNH